MRCVNPVYIKLVDLWVPCGKCMMCRIARASEWAVRLTQHLESVNGSGVFLTLTYNDDNLPADLSLKKYEFVCWMKRLRKEIEPLKVKYYACGEYGEEGGRPHYHAIIFGMRPDLKTQRIMEKTWTNGFVKLGTVTYDSCRYVAEYISKGVMSGTTIRQLQLDHKELPFALMSQGIGKDFVNTHKAELLKNLSTKVRGKDVGMPRYYKKILGLTAEELGPKAQEVQVKKLKQLLNAVKGKEDAIFDRVVSGRRQAIKNVNGKKAVKDLRDPSKKAKDAY